MVEIARQNNTQALGVTFSKLDGQDNGFHTKNGFAGTLYERSDDGSAVYVTFRDSQNMYGKKNSYALSVTIMEELRRRDISTVVVVEDHDTVYLIDLERFIETENVLDYGQYDKQKAPPITESRKTLEHGYDRTDRYPDSFSL